MAKVKEGVEALITREQFHALKKMDRQEAEAFIRIIFDKGYNKGCKDTEANLKAESAASGQQMNFKEEFISILTTISGIGPATLRKIKEALEKWSV